MIIKIDGTFTLARMGGTVGFQFYDFGGAGAEGQEGVEVVGHLREVTPLPVATGQPEV